MDAIADLSVRSIVTVINPNSPLCKKQGEVVEIDDDNKIRVKFARRDYIMFDFNYDSGNSCVFMLEDLEINMWWDISVRAEMLFYRYYHSTSKLTSTELIPVCMYESCDQSANKRVHVNYWGTVCEVDLCCGCAKEWDGKMIEHFPFSVSK